MGKILYICLCIYHLASNGSADFFGDSLLDLASSEARLLPLSCVLGGEVGPALALTGLELGASWAVASASVGARLGVLLTSLDKYRIGPASRTDLLSDDFCGPWNRSL